MNTLAETASYETFIEWQRHASTNKKELRTSFRREIVLYCIFSQLVECEDLFWWLTFWIWDNSMFLLYWLYLPHGLPLWNKRWQEWWRDSNVVDDDDGDESWWAGNNWKDAWGWRCPIRQPPTLPRCLPTLLHPPAPTLPTISSCELSLSWFVWQTWFWDQTQEKRPLLL